MSKDYFETVDEMEELLLAFKTMVTIAGDAEPKKYHTVVASSVEIYAVPPPDARRRAVHWLMGQNVHMHNMVIAVIKHRRESLFESEDDIAWEAYQDAVEGLLKGINFLRFLPATGDPWRLMELAVAAGTPHLPPIYPDAVKALK